MRNQRLPNLEDREKGSTSTTRATGEPDLNKKGLYLLLAIASLLLPGCYANKSYYKNYSVMELEFQLRSKDGTPLADFPMSVDIFYYDDYTTNATTDANGRYFSSRSTNSVGGNILLGPFDPLVEPFRAPREVINYARMDLYLPSVNPYGEYQVAFVAPEPAEGPSFDSSLDRPRIVPLQIAVDEDASWRDPSKFAHGAYYYGTGGLMMTEIVGNGEERLVPLSSRGDHPHLNKITVGEHPRLQISANATPLETARGWRFQVLLVLEPFVPIPPPSKHQAELEDPAQTREKKRVSLRAGSEVRVGDLTLILESASYEQRTDFTNESIARVRVRRGGSEETVELSRRHANDPVPTAVLGYEIYLEAAISHEGLTQAVVWVR